MDHQIANPLWHACLLLSYWPGEGQKIEVKNAWGFYAAPSSDTTSRFFKLKQALKIPYDLQGNHGVLKEEELRFLDLGYGLQGMTFEISLEQFFKLKKICKEIIDRQDDVFTEVKERLTTLSHTPNSLEIYEEEKRLAIAEHRPPRLEPFEFKLPLNHSFTCKGMAIKLLKEIGIEPEHLDYLTHHNSSNAFPRYSGRLEPIFFHSEGIRNKHISERTGTTRFFRKWQDKGTKLFWTLPPQFLVSHSEELKSLLSLSKDQIQSSKLIVSQLQKLEHMIVNLNLTEINETNRSRLLQRICELYQSFATVSSKQNEDEPEQKIQDCKDFLNNLYFAMNDEWEDEDEIEGIAAKFPNKVQNKICQLLGRPYAKKIDSSNLTQNEKPLPRGNMILA